MRLCRFCLILGLLVAPKLAVAIGEFECSAEATIGNKYIWSMAAMSDVINTYYGYRCPVNLPEMVKMAEAIKENPRRTSAELRCICAKERIRMTTQRLYVVEKGKPCGTGACVAEPMEACNIFIKDLIKANNRYAVSIRAATRPGTYVQMHSCNSGGRNVPVYKIVNVVPGADNSVYLINSNGRIARATNKTLRNDTFINETAQSENVAAGEIRGIYNNSYIFLTDVTHKVYEMVNSGAGTPFYSIGAAGHLLPGGDYDVKTSWTKQECDPRNFGFRVPGQTDTDAHTNGVIFKGQIITLEQLGHIITGFHQEGSMVSDEMVDSTIEKLQSGKLGENVIRGALVGSVTQPVRPIGTIVGAVGGFAKTPRADEIPSANELRYAAKDQISSERDNSTFISTQTETKEQAFDMARRNMASRYRLPVDKISCSGDCNIVGNDFVTCYYRDAGQSKVVIYQFDDICD